MHFVKGLINYTKYDPNKQEGAISTYQVANEIEIDDDDDTKEVTFHVYFNEDELEIQCNCCLFEFRGILYRHAFSVLIMIKRIKILPSKYILPRWSKDFKWRYTFIKSIYDDLSRNPEAQHYDKLKTYFYKVASMASKLKKVVWLWWQF